MFDFGLRLKELRTKYGLRQKELAKKLKISPSTISQWENNYKFPSVVNLVKLADIFNVPLDYLVGIRHDKVITINQLKDSQQKLLKVLIKELKSGNGSLKGLTKEHQELINLLMQEFKSSDK